MIPTPSTQLPATADEREGRAFDALFNLYIAGRWMLPVEEVPLSAQIALWDAAKTALLSEPMLMSEQALALCHEIEAQSANEQLTKCSVLASQLRRELEIYEQTRPLTDEENARIEGA